MVTLLKLTKLAVNNITNRRTQFPLPVAPYHILAAVGLYMFVAPVGRAPFS